MNILFVYTVSYAPPPPAKPLIDWTEVSFGISYIASVLERAGHKIQLVVLRREQFESDIDRVLQDFQPRLLCFTPVATEYSFVEKIAQYFRDTIPQAYYIIGGPHASLQPMEVLKGPFNAVCIGEGEDAVVELVKFLEKEKQPTLIPNLWIKQGNSIERNATRPLIQQLDEIPFPHREMWRPWVDSNIKHSLLLGRGCPFTCTYCCNHALRKLAAGKYVRFRSPSQVLEEVHWLCEKFPDISEIYFEVETITAKPKWGIELADLLEKFNASRPTPLKFGVNVSVLRKKRLDKLFEALSHAGFSYINVGIESGSERVRQDILRRNYTNEDLITACEDARRVGLSVNAYNLIGLPGETPEDFQQTIEINRKCLPDENRLSIFYPYPGTDLHKVCVERDLKLQHQEDNAERFRASLGLPEFPNRKIEHYFRWFDFLVYKGKRPLATLLNEYLWKTMAAHPRFTRWYRRYTNQGVLFVLKRSLKYLILLFSKKDMIQKSVK